MTPPKWGRGKIFDVYRKGVFVSGRTTSVSIATFIAIATAPIVALLVTQAFQSIKEDPAAGSGPISTVIQDMISVLIYGIVCSIIIL